MAKTAKYSFGICPIFCFWTLKSQKFDFKLGFHVKFLPQNRREMSRTSPGQSNHLGAKKDSLEQTPYSIIRLHPEHCVGNLNQRCRVEKSRKALGNAQWRTLFSQKFLGRSSVHSSFWIRNTQNLTRAWMFLFFTREIEAKTRKNIRNSKKT